MQELANTPGNVYISSGIQADDLELLMSRSVSKVSF